MHQISQINALQQPQTAVSAMPEVQSEMDASDLLKMILQLRGQGNPTPTKKSSDSNNQAQILINQISQMNALQQPQTGLDPMASLRMPTQQSPESNNQALMRMLMNQTSQMNAPQQPHTAVDLMAALKMFSQLHGLEGVQGENAAPSQKDNVGVGINDLVAALRETR